MPASSALAARRNLKNSVAQPLKGDVFWYELCRTWVYIFCIGDIMLSLLMVFACGGQGNDTALDAVASAPDGHFILG